MSLEDIKRKAEAAAKQAQANFSNEKSSVEAQTNDAYKFLQDAGVNTSSISINFDNNTFELTGTVEEGEQLEVLNGAVAGSGSSSAIVNNVELEDFTSKNITMKVTTKGSNLNVRAGVGTGNDIVGKFANGSEVSLVKKIQKDWYLVRNNEIEGYCHTNFLT